MDTISFHSEWSEKVNNKPWIHWYKEQRVKWNLPTITWLPVFCLPGIRWWNILVSGTIYIHGRVCVIIHHSLFFQSPGRFNFVYIYYIHNTVWKHCQYLSVVVTNNSLKFFCSARYLITCTVMWKIILLFLSVVNNEIVLDNI